MSDTAPNHCTQSTDKQSFLPSQNSDFLYGTERIYGKELALFCVYCLSLKETVKWWTRVQWYIKTQRSLDDLVYLSNAWFGEMLTFKFCKGRCANKMVFTSLAAVSECMCLCQRESKVHFCDCSKWRNTNATPTFQTCWHVYVFLTVKKITVKVSSQSWLLINF